MQVYILLTQSDIGLFEPHKVYKSMDKAQAEAISEIEDFYDMEKAKIQWIAGDYSTDGFINGVEFARIATREMEE